MKSRILGLQRDKLDESRQEMAECRSMHRCTYRTHKMRQNGKVCKGLFIDHTLCKDTHARA